MKVIMLAPKVVENFISKFPEVSNNAYKYFNYDNRVIDKSVYNHDNHKIPYKTPEQLTDLDYSSLVAHAKTLLNPILMKYSNRIACEDAMSLAIGSYRKGLFDHKVNAGRFSVLVEAMQQPDVVLIPVNAKNIEKKPEVKKPVKPEADKSVVVKPHVLKGLGLSRKDLPRETNTYPAKKKEHGIVIDKKNRIVSK